MYDEHYEKMWFFETVLSAVLNTFTAFAVNGKSINEWKQSVDPLTVEGEERVVWEGLEGVNWVQMANLWVMNLEKNWADVKMKCAIF